jgi:hypothetical protein
LCGSLATIVLEPDSSLSSQSLAYLRSRYKVVLD